MFFNLMFFNVTKTSQLIDDTWSREKSFAQSKEGFIRAKRGPALWNERKEYQYLTQWRIKGGAH